MVHNSESLETKLDRPDLRQWLPVYGMYQVKQDLVNGKPTVIDAERGAVSFCGSAAYHAVFFVAGAYTTVTLLYCLSEKIF